MVVLSGLIMIAYMFMCVIALVATIPMVKVVSKVHVENGVNHRTCGCNGNAVCFQGFKDSFCCDFKFNEELMYLWIALKFYIIHFKRS